MLQIALCGSQSFWGKKLLQVLQDDAEVDGLLCLDSTVPGQLGPKVTATRLSFKKPFDQAWTSSMDKFSPEALIICPPTPDACLLDDPTRHVDGVQNALRVLRKALDLKVPRIVLLSTVLAYGARLDNPVFLDEDALLLGDRNFQHIRDIIELEEAALAASAQSDFSKIIILRPALVLGPTVDNALMTYLRLPVLPCYLGFDPVLQLIHEDDVITAIRLALATMVSGPVNLAARDFISLSELATGLGKIRLPIFHSFADMIWQSAWSMNFSGLSPAFTAVLRFRLIVETKKSRDLLGFRPQHSIRSALQGMR